MRRWMALLAGLCCTISVAPASAQVPVESFVGIWAENGISDRQAIHVVGHFRSYENTFATETHARVSYWIDGNMWRMDLVPWEGNSSTKKDEDGRDYKIQLHPFERWVRTDATLLQMCDEDDSAPRVAAFDLKSSGESSFFPVEHVFSQPPHDPRSPAYPIWRAWSGKDVLGERRLSKPDATISPWAWSIGNLHAPEGDDGRIHLVGRPLDERSSLSYSAIEFLLNSRDYSPIALRMTSPANTSETVIIFQRSELREVVDCAVFEPCSIAEWPPRIE